MADVLVASDNADRANGPIGSDWQALNSDSIFTIASQHFQKGSGQTSAVWISDDFDADQYVEVQLRSIHNSSTGDGGAGAVLRGHTDVNSWYAIVGSGLKSQVWVVENGTATQLYTNSGQTWADSDVMRAQIVGSTITVSQNGTQVYTVDVSEHLISGGRAGMIAFSPNFGTIWLDDWAAGNIVSETPTFQPAWARGSNVILQ